VCGDFDTQGRAIGSSCDNATGLALLLAGGYRSARLVAIVMACWGKGSFATSSLLLEAQWIS